MPLCDAYIPTDALDPDAERKLASRVSEILVSHEARRIIDLMDDPGDVEAVYKRAAAISWLFVHRTDAYVAGKPVQAPIYRFVVNVPEGQIDDQFVPAINRDIFQAVVEAEAGKWPNPERRLWVTVHEVYDGRWGSAGRQLPLKDIIDVVSPGWGEHAEQRFAEQKAARAVATVELAAGTADPGSRRASA